MKTRDLQQRRTTVPRAPAAHAPARAFPEVRNVLHAPRPQAKLSVSTPDDEYEREADQMSDKIMTMPEGKVPRMCTDCEEEMDEGGGTIGRKEEGFNPTGEVPSGFAARFAALHGGGQPLPDSERAFFEPRFGRDFANVRVHSGPDASALARSVQARAFTLGDSVVLGAGQYTPGTPSGRALLAHELTHVVQQGHRTPIPDE